MESKTEADSNDITECPCDDRPSSGMFGFLTLHVHSLICLSCLHCFLVAVLYDCSLVTCNIKVVCVKSLNVFATMLLCEEIMQSLCTFWRVSLRHETEQNRLNGSVGVEAG